MGMFENDRYQTRGVKESIPLELQVIMWGLIDQASSAGEELDYLQVFEIEEIGSSDGQKKIRIKHTQEVPNKQASYTVELVENGTLVSERIFVIDDGSCSTMLLASDY